MTNKRYPEEPVTGTLRRVTRRGREMRRWRKENREAIKEYNARVLERGVFGEWVHRHWAASPPPVSEVQRQGADADERDDAQDEQFPGAGHGRPPSERIPAPPEAGSDPAGADR